MNDRTPASPPIPAALREAGGRAIRELEAAGHPVHRLNQIRPDQRAAGDRAVRQLEKNGIRVYRVSEVYNPERARIQQRQRMTNLPIDQIDNGFPTDRASSNPRSRSNLRRFFACAVAAVALATIPANAATTISGTTSTHPSSP